MTNGDATKINPVAQLMYSTVRIEAERADKSQVFGSGFIFRFCRDGEKHLPAIVTNRHVVQGAVKGTFVMSTRHPDGTRNNGAYQRCILPDFEDRWINHPDPNVDLCALPLGPVISHVEKATGNRPFWVSLGYEIVPDAAQLEQFMHVEDILMIGYPTGIWDDKHNLPVARKGITATHPGLDFRGYPCFLVDIGCLPGSSGSPIFVFNMGGYVAGDELVMGGRVLLVGVLFAGSQLPVTGGGTIVQSVASIETTSHIPANIGFALTSQLLRDMDEVLRKAAGS